MAIFDRIAVRAVHRSRSRVDRFKLTKKPFIRQLLLADDAIAEAVKEHSAETSVSEAETWKRVEDYIDEIVPFFNILTYYKIGMVVSRMLLNFFYKVSAEYAGRPSRDALPRDAIVIYLMNHRSNADYVLVGYVLSGQVAISYAVGEWARTFPLEYIFKSFGAYFVRRKYREKLYHTVLERYVQLITAMASLRESSWKAGSVATANWAKRKLVCSTTCSASRGIRSCARDSTSSRLQSTTIGSWKIAHFCASSMRAKAAPDRRDGRSWPRLFAMCGGTARASSRDAGSVMAARRW